MKKIKLIFLCLLFGCSSSDDTINILDTINLEKDY